VKEVAQLIKKAAVIEKPLVSRDTPRPNQVMDVVADISRAEGDLGWHPTTKLADGIAQVVASAKGTSV
jgi:nucleoside-diphosphate-sugar epimerase